MKACIKTIMIAVCLMMVGVLMGAVVAVEAEAAYGESEDLTSLSIISRSDGGSVERIVDADYETRVFLGEGTELTIVCPENIKGIYVIWDTVPGEWNLTLDNGQTLQCGGAGFIHEYIEAGGARKAVITIPSNDTKLCDIYVLGEGELPDWVQTWLPQYEQADILVVATHSDDEVLFFGGLLPVYAQEQGYKVQMAYLTNHWLERLRPHELLCGLWTAGIRVYPEISEFADLSAFNDKYNIEEFEEYGVWLLRRFKPSVVVTQDLNGEYGHKTHIMGSNAMLRAYEAAADENCYEDSAVEFGVWRVSKYYVHMYPDDQLVMDWHIPLRAFEGRTGLEVADESYGCHLSQHQWVFQIYEDGRGDCRLFGLYSSTVGEDTGLDLMENTGIAPENGLFASMAGINNADAQGGNDNGA